MIIDTNCSVGKQIKALRKQKGLSRNELADERLSEPELFEIEHGRSNPTRDIVEHIYQKLNHLPTLDNRQAFEQCGNWFNYLLRGELDKAEELLPILEHNREVIKTVGLAKLIDIHMLSYYTQKKSLEKAKALFDSLQPRFSTFKNTEIYYWFKFSGDYYFSTMAYEAALTSYYQAEEVLEQGITINQQEINDLYYIKAVTASKLNKTMMCMDYAEKALNFYQSNNQLHRAAECHILLGISHSKNNTYLESKEHFFSALEIAETHDDYYLIDLCSQNLGKLAETTEDFDNAISYYKDSYDLNRNSADYIKIIPISSLMKLYYKRDDLKNAEIWLKKGVEISEHLEPNDSIYYYEFKVYAYLIYGYDETFEPLIVNEIIPFLQKKELLYEEHTYLKLLADYCFLIGEYQRSADYYRDALHILSNLVRKKVIE